MQQSTLYSLFLILLVVGSAYGDDDWSPPPGMNKYGLLIKRAVEGKDSGYDNLAAPSAISGFKDDNKRDIDASGSFNEVLDMTALPRVSGFENDGKRDIV
uniref:Organ specific protein n=1 Tax=Panagrellus redivivus TaxID=6233 RepID=A0A7E4V1G1_PANRE